MNPKDRQYKASKASIRNFELELAKLDDDHDLTAEQRELLSAAYRNQIDDIATEAQAYEALRDGAVRLEPIESMEALRLALIHGRIARGWTQAQLADALGVSEQQVQKDEMNRYASVRVERLENIAATLGMEIRATVRFPTGASSGDAVELERMEKWRKPLTVWFLARQRERWKQPVQGHLALQKLLLLLHDRLERDLGWNVFKFEPYLYGPYDPDLEDDLELLMQHDLVSKTVRTHVSDRITLADDERLVFIEAGSKATSWLGHFMDSPKLEIGRAHV